MTNILLKVIDRINFILRPLYFINKKSKLQGVGRTIVCNNCTGSMMLHDLGLRFDTPTVNLFMTPDDYVSFVKRLPEIAVEEIKQIHIPGCTYPVGVIGGGLLFILCIIIVLMKQYYLGVVGQNVLIWIIYI